MAIVTITFSPCIDKSTSIAALIPEKKMKCAEPALEPGGGGVNVARAITKLGGEALAIFPSGGYTGKYFNHLLEKENVPSVIIESSHETRENFIVLDQSSNEQFRFGMPGTTLGEKEWRKCLKAVEETKSPEYIVASGSLPPGVPLNVYAQLARIAKIKNAKFVVDTEGEALKEAANEGVYLLKPNLGELCMLTGHEAIDVEIVEDIARQLVLKNKCRIIVVSLGKEGAVLVTKDRSYRAIPPAVIQKSTVGAGDSMVAGIVYSLYKDPDLLKALRYGVACGTAATLQPGTSLCNKEDVEHLFKLIR